MKKKAAKKAPSKKVAQKEVEKNENDHFDQIDNADKTAVNFFFFFFFQ
jgi:hypothetical protein